MPNVPEQPAAPQSPPVPDTRSGAVLYEVADGVATITLNEPATRNALSAELLGRLIAALERARDDADVRCVVLASSHEKVFSSGANLGGFAGMCRWCTSTSAASASSGCSS